MRREYRKQLQRKAFDPPDCVYDAEIRMGASRLRMRLLIAPNLKAYRRLVTAALPADPSLARTSTGCCSPLSYWVKRIYKNGKLGPRREVFDPRYFAVMILCATKCGVELVTHECGHAAIYYAKRVTSHRWRGAAGKNVSNRDDERVCYPLGLLCRIVFRELYDAGVWKEADAAQYRYRS